MWRCWSADVAWLPRTSWIRGRADHLNPLIVTGRKRSRFTTTGRLYAPDSMCSVMMMTRPSKWFFIEKSDLFFCHKQGWIMATVASQWPTLELRQHTHTLAVKMNIRWKKKISDKICVDVWAPHTFEQNQLNLAPSRHHHHHHHHSWTDSSLESTCKKKSLFDSNNWMSFRQGAKKKKRLSISFE